MVSTSNLKNEKYTSRGGIWVHNKAEMLELEILIQIKLDILKFVENFREI